MAYGCVATTRLLEPPVARQHVVVGRDDALHHGLAEPEGGLDHHLVLALADGVDREQHAGHVGLDHALHDHRHAQVVQAALALAVEDRVLAEERRPAVAHALHHAVGAAHVQVRVLLPGVARSLGVLRHRAGAHGQRRAVAEHADGLGDRSLQTRRQRRGLHQRRGRLAGLLPLAVADRGQALAQPDVGPAVARVTARASASTTKPPRDGRPSAAMRARLEPLPPAASTAAAAGSSSRAIIARSSSTIAIARTGAAVVPTHFTGSTDSVKPCGRPICSRFMRFSRCQYSSSHITRCASQNTLRSNIAHTGGSNVMASQPIMRTPWEISQRVASAVIPGWSVR